MPSKTGYRWSHPPPGEEVVISGIAGRFPDSNNVQEFRDNLMNKVDLVSDDDRRWKVKHPEVPQRTGKINNVNKFDANFFGIHSKNVHTTDPLCRMVLEHTYEAIADAGVNPKDLHGTRTGVFMGASFSESEKTLFYEKMHKEGFGIIGCSRSMYANRISYFLGVHGPSYTVDSACSSSLTCLENAYKAIRDGLCDAAIIGGTQLCLFPSVSLNFARLGVLSPEGKSNCFDESANGYARAEAISAIFLQKAKDAKRIYATVKHSKLNHDGYKEKPIEHPSGEMQQQLLEDFYVECDIDPSCIPYVECHSNGLRISDPQELNAIDRVFCKNRNTPLLIGSVKSNMGHTDPASGLCSLVKVLLCFETGYILPNLHYEVPREEIEGLQEGRMEVVTEPTKWDGGLVGLNNFGFGGSNAHVLLQGNSKKKVDKGVPKDGIPRLVCISGRTEQSVNTILEYLESTELDAEFIRLLQDVNSTEVSGFIYRGYSVLQPGPQRISRDTQYYSGEKKPVWFVFSGMGSQWPGMGTALMKIPVFAAAIERCHQALAPKGVDITKIITDTDSTMFDNILHSFVGIAAIQIGLVDVLTEIGIKPDYIIGHSVGELGCAYADGCFTAEQMILAAYSRGLASIETDVIRGLMAAVGLGYEEVKDMCPPDIEVACHNSASSCTLSGPTESMKKFVAELQDKGIFAREVNCSNIAYHSRYIADAGPRLLKYLKEVIPDPKPRSEKWVSSSVPESEWDSEVAKYSSAEYHTNNLLKPVLFEETARRIPKNAIAIEIAPHGLLQAILRRSLHKDTVNVALTQRGHKDNTQVLLTAIGKLYQQGLTPQISKLYPDIKFPVSRGTQMISPLLRWEHSVDWFMTTHKGKDNTVEGDRNVNINMNDEENEYLKSNIVGGFNLYPVGSLLVSVWETLAILQGVSYKKLPVIFDNIRVARSIQLPQEKSMSFTIMVQKGTGNFEVHQNGSVIINGRISVPDKIDKELLDLEPPEIEPVENSIQLTNTDVYKELRVRGYDYSGVFKSIVECDISATRGRIQWRDNWAAYIENMIQFRYLHEEKRSIFAPSSIKKIIIDPKKHFYHQEENEEEIQDDQEIENNSQQTIIVEDKDVTEDKTEIDDTAPVYFYKKSGIIKSAGIEIRGLKLVESFNRKSVGEQVLEKLEFIPYFSINNFKIQDAVSLCIQIGLENTSYTNIRIIEVDNCITNPLAEIIASTIKHYPHIQGIVTVLSSRPLKLTHGIKVENKSLINESNNVFLIGTDFVNNPDVLKTAHKVLKKDGFIISREKKSVKVNKLDGFYNVISELSTVGDEKLVVLQKVKGFKPSPNVIINVTDKIGSDPFGYVEQIKQAIRLNKSVLLVSQHEPFSGVYGLVSSLRKDYQFDADQIRCMFILDPTAPIFNVKEALYKEQLDLGLIINIYKDGVWGSFRNIEIENEIRIGVKHAYVDVTKNGDLSSLRWIEGPLNHYLPSEVSVDIYYSALNFRDVMVATGYLSREIVVDDRLQECILGLEFVGRETRSGRRVMGLVRGGALSTRIEAVERDFVWPVPSNWTFEDAATVPLAYITAYRALIQIADMKAGQKVLIHAGAGGVGQAALHLALYYGCEVFTTVGSPEKRAFIKKYFPQIQDDHICNSRDTSFEQQILKITSGKGVDLILNSLSDDKLKATAACIAIGGQFLEIGKLNMDKNNTVGMEMFLKETQLHGVTVDNIFTAYDEEKRDLHNLIKNGIQVGAVRPLMRTVFNDNEIESAFKFMGVGKHIGKVLVNIRPEENQRTVVPKERYVAAIPKFFCDTSKSYVIIGGFEGFEFELVDWLVFRQARKIVLATKQGIKTGYQAMRMRIWKKLGAEIKVLATDVTSRDGVAALLHAASLMGPVDAIFHPIVAQHEVLFDQQTPERFVKAYREIAVTVKQLDEVSRKMCPHLRYFVSFSSETKPGQSDHSTACSIVERICEKRKNENLSGVAIRWSAIDDLTKENKFEKGEEQKRHFELSQNVASCLETLNKVLKQNAPIVVSKVVRRKLIGVDRDVVDAVADIMGIHDLHKIDMNETFSSMQIDWMKTITIRNTLERDFEIFLTVKDVSFLTFAKLQEISEEQADAVIEYESSGRGEIASLSMAVHVVGDEELSTEPIVRLHSLAVPGDCSPIIFLIPGIDGVHNGFSSFAEKLSGQIVCLQLGYNNLATSVEQMADSILPILKSQLVPKQQFGILGYSFGSLIALELAYRLEAEGKSSFNVCLIDGAPLLFRELIEQYVQADNMDSLEVAAITSVADIVAPQYSSELEVRLRQIRGWTAKVSAFIETVPEGDYSKHHLKLVCEAIYKRFIAAYNYRPDSSKKLQTTVNLIRPKIHLIPNLSEDYDMSEYTAQPVSVSFIRGNHATILEQKKCTEVVNTTMDDRIAFKQLMLCEIQPQKDQCVAEVFYN